MKTRKRRQDPDAEYNFWQPATDMMSALVYVLLLIIAYRNDISIVKEDIGSHQYRIHEKPCRSRFLPSALILELSHPGKLAGVGAACQYP